MHILYFHIFYIIRYIAILNCVIFTYIFMLHYTCTECVCINALHWLYLNIHFVCFVCMSGLATICMCGYSFILSKSCEFWFKPTVNDKIFTSVVVLTSSWCFCDVIEILCLFYRLHCIVQGYIIDSISPASHHCFVPLL